MTTTKNLHDRLVMALGKVALPNLFAPIEREVLLTLLEAVEPLYRPTPPEEASENAIKAVEIEALGEHVTAMAVQYILACDAAVDAAEKYPAIGLWKDRLRAAVTEYRRTLEEQYG